MPALLAALLAKSAGLGTAAKAAIAAVTAALTVTVAGGASGVLPLPGGTTEAAVSTQAAATPAAIDVAASVTPTTAAKAAVQASTPSTSASAKAGSTSARVAATAPAVTTSTSVVPVPDLTRAAGLPAIGSLPSLPALPACLAELVPAAGTRPDPAVLMTKLPACIRSLIATHLPLDTLRQLVGSARLPVDVSACVSSVLSSVPGLAQGNMAGLSQFLSACVPAGAFPGTGSLPGLGSLPGFGAGR